MANERMSQFAGPDRFERQAGRVREAYGRAQEVVGDHPGYSALACFGIGVGVGTVLTLLLMPEKKHKAWYKDYVPDKHFADDLTDQVRATVGRMVPDAVARYLKRK